MRAGQPVTVVVDWSLPLEDHDAYEALGRRRADVAREMIRRLGDSVSHVVLYSETARVGSITDLDARVTFDLVYGSNLQQALRLARGVSEAGGRRRVVLISSSAPSAHVQPNGAVFFSFPSVRATLQATAEEISECERADLRIDALVLGGYDNEPHDRLVVLAALIRDLTAPVDGCVLASEADEPTATLVDRFLTAADLSS